VIPTLASAAASSARVRRTVATVAAATVGLLILVVMMAGGAVTSVTAASSASACTSPGQVNPAVLAAGGRPSWWNSDGKGAERDQNAAVIIGTARGLGLPDRAAVVAVATAMQEAKLVNLPGGDRDSRGLFQQRVMYYGTTIPTDPVQSTKAFLGPRGSVPGLDPSIGGLLDIPNWQQLPLTQAAQAVQRSAYPDAYAEWETLSTQLVLAAGRTTAAGPAATSTATSASTAAAAGESLGGRNGANVNAANAGCAAGYVNLSGIPGNPGSPFKDGPIDSILLPKPNPRSVQQAVAWAVTQQQAGTTGWYRSCLAFVADAYGWGGSGVSYAIDEYTSLPSQYRHDGDRNPPPGSLLFWTTGSRPGHVALYLGQGMIATTDMPTSDRVGVVPAEWIEQKWGSTYVGWSPPYFPAGA